MSVYLEVREETELFSVWLIEQVEKDITEILLPHGEFPYKGPSRKRDQCQSARNFGRKVARVLDIKCYERENRE